MLFNRLNSHYEQLEHFHRVKLCFSIYSRTIVTLLPYSYFRFISIVFHKCLFTYAKNIKKCVKRFGKHYKNCYLQSITFSDTGETENVITY